MKDIKETLCCIPNSIVSTNQKLDVHQKDVICMAIGYLYTLGDNMAQTEIIVDLKELHRATGTTIRQSSYIQKAKDSIFKLGKTVIEIEDRNGNRTSIPWLQQVTESSEMSESNIPIEDHEISVKLNPAVLRLLSKMEGYTSCFLPNILSLRKFYAKRIYELAMQYKPTRDAKPSFIPLEQLREMLQLNQVQPKRKNEQIRDIYESFELLNRKVLKPAKEEINDKTDINISYEYHRTDRKIDGVKIIMEFKSQQIADSYKPKRKSVAVKVSQVVIKQDQSQSESIGFKLTPEERAKSDEARKIALGLS